MTSAIDITKPTATVAYTSDVRANFAAAKAEIEALQEATAGGGYIQSTYTPEDGLSVRFVTPNPTDFVALWTVDTIDTDSGGVWVSSGVTTGTGNTGIVGIGSADANGTGASGTTYLTTGNAPGGISGDIIIAIGTSSNPGAVRVNSPAIVHDAATISVATFGPDPAEGGAYGIVAPGLNIVSNDPNNTTGFWLFSVDNPTGGTQGGGVGSGAATGGISGEMWFYSGDATGAPSGDVWIMSGDVDGDGGNYQAGKITIGPGAASNGATAGNIEFINAAQVIFSGAPGGEFVMGMPSRFTQQMDYPAAPQADPHVFGRIWADPADGFTLKQSQG